MRNIFFYCVLFLILCVDSCKNAEKEYETIKFDLHLPNSNYKINIKSLVKLESSGDRALIGKISKIVFYSDHFFVLDQMVSKALFVFDKNGKFIAKTKYGKGPGECLWPWTFTIDPVKQTICLWDQMTHNMTEYDFNLNFIKATYYGNITIDQMAWIGNDTVLVNSTIPLDKSYKSYCSYCIYTNNFSKEVNKILPIPTELMNISLSSPICKTDNVLLVNPSDNNIYRLEKATAKLMYKLDFGDLAVTSNDVKKEIDYIFYRVNKGEKIMSVDGVLKNNQFLAFSFAYKRRLNFFIHSKETCRNYSSMEMAYKNELPMCTLSGIMDDGTFIGVSEASEIKKFTFKDKAYQKMTQNTKELDNPIIVFFKIDERLKS